MKNRLTGLMLVAMVGLFVVPVQAAARSAEDIKVVGDFSGAGVAQVATFRPSTGTWYIPSAFCSAAPCAPVEVKWGTVGDVPHAADVDGDGRAELIIYRPSDGTWNIANLASSACSTTSPCHPIVVQWGGQADDVSLVADFEGDGRADLGIYRQSTGETWVLRSACTAGAYSCYALVAAPADSTIQ